MIILRYFFLFLHENICCGYLLEAPCQGASNEYPQHTFLWRTGENYPIIITKYSPLDNSSESETSKLLCMLPQSLGMYARGP